MSDRLQWVDVAKGIGIILVVVGHLNRGLFDAGINPYAQAASSIDTVIYSFHMPLFFFLSGLFLQSSLSKRSAMQAARSKFLTIFRPYLIWSFIYAVIGVLLTQYTNSTLQSSAIYTFLWLPAGHMWFLYALFLISLLMIAVFKGLPQLPSWGLLLLAAISFYAASDLSALFALKRAAEHIVYLVLGVIVARHMYATDGRGVLAKVLGKRESTKQATTPWLWPMLLAFLVLQVAAFLFDSGQLSFVEIKTFELCLAIISIAFVISLSMALAPGTFASGLNFLGRYSMQIYLLHTLAMVACRVVLQKFLHVEILWLHLVLGGVFGLLAPIIIAKVLEQRNLSFLLGGR